MATQQYDARARRRLIAYARRHQYIVETAAQAGAQALWREWARLIRGPVRRWITRLAMEQRLGQRQLTVPEELLEEGMKALPAVIREVEKLLATYIGTVQGLMGLPLWEIAVADLEHRLERAAKQTWGRLLNPDLLLRRIDQAIQQGRGLEGAIALVIDSTARRYHEAERLVRTELNGALVHTAGVSYADAGAEELEWLTAQDSRVRGMRPHDRANHVAMHGQRRKMSQADLFRTPLGSLMRWPGDRMYNPPAAEIVNCRCTVVPIFPDKLVKPEAPKAKPKPKPKPKPTPEPATAGPPWDDPDTIASLRLAGVLPDEDWERWYAHWRMRQPALSKRQAAALIDRLSLVVVQAFAKAVPESAPQELTKAIRAALNGDRQALGPALQKAISGLPSAKRLDIADVVRKTGEVVEQALGAFRHPVAATHQLKLKEAGPKVKKAYEFVMGLLHPERQKLYEPPNVIKDSSTSRSYHSASKNMAALSPDVLKEDLGSTMAHELGHWLERWMRTEQRSARFILDRATGPLKKLRELSPGLKYESDEYAFPGDFLDPYVGKPYTAGGYATDPTNWRASEVVSMGFEYLYRWTRGSTGGIQYLGGYRLLALHRDHLRYILGLIMEMSGAP